jgi:hypothetical protein
MDESTSSTAPIQNSTSGRRLVRCLSEVLPAPRLRLRTEVSIRRPAAINPMPSTWMARRTCPPLQLYVAHDSPLTTVGCTAPTADRAGRPTQGHHQPDSGIAEQQDQRKHSIGNTASGMDRLTAKKDAQHPTVTAGSPRQR